jgi:hypothetical protein
MVCDVSLTLKISECWNWLRSASQVALLGFDGDSHAVSQLTKAQFDQDSMRYLQGRFQSCYFKMVVFPREHIESFVQHRSEAEAHAAADVMRPHIGVASTRAPSPIWLTAPYAIDLTMISPYEHGRNAARRGKHIQACPFDTGSAEWREWRDGFLMSARDHLYNRTRAAAVDTAEYGLNVGAAIDLSWHVTKANHASRPSKAVLIRLALKDQGDSFATAATHG